MTKEEACVNAWRLRFKGDYSLVDKIYHPDYSTSDRTTGVEANLHLLQLLLRIKKF